MLLSYVTFQMAKVVVSPQMFPEIFSLTARLRAHPRQHEGAESDYDRRRRRGRLDPGNAMRLAPRGSQIAFTPTPAVHAADESPWSESPKGDRGTR